MNRINTLFETKKQHVLSVYFTAGYPDLNDTVSIIESLQTQGVDLIEIGIPFSDPLADGPVIQASGEQALHNGMTLKLLFEQLKDIRKTVHVPLIMMGYLNPVMQYGVDAFCEKCAEIGIDGVILPDLPLDVYENEYQAIFEKQCLKNIFLITPQTSENRIKQIDKASNSFIYMVSSSSTTGNNTDFGAEQEAYFSRVKSLDLKNPLMIGFGISDRKSFDNACKYANGAIIGSAFIKAVGNKNEGINKKVTQFVEGIVSVKQEVFD